MNGIAFRNYFRIGVVIGIAVIILVGGSALAQIGAAATEGGERVEPLFSQSQPDGFLDLNPQQTGGSATETGIRPEFEGMQIFMDGFAPDDNVPTDGASAPQQTFSYYMVSGPGLQPRSTANDQVYSSSGCSYMSTGSSTGLLTGTGMHLPNDSVIKFIRLYYYDTDASNGVDAFLTRYAPGSAVQDLVSTGSTNAFNSGSGFTVSTEITETVNAASYSYILYAWPDIASTALRYCGIRVAYYAPPYGLSFLPSLNR